MIRRPPRSTLFPYTTPLPICIRAGTQRMGELIDDLLKLSRVTRSEMHRTTVDLSAIAREDRKSTRLNSSHANISYAVFCLKKKKVALDRQSTSLNSSHANKSS